MNSSVKSMTRRYSLHYALRLDPEIPIIPIYRYTPNLAQILPVIFQNFFFLAIYSFDCVHDVNCIFLSASLEDVLKGAEVIPLCLLVYTMTVEFSTYDK